MPNSIADILKQLRAIIQTMSAGKMMALFLLMTTTVAGLVLFVSWSGSPDFMPLYSNMSPEDAGEVVSMLRGRKIDYRLSHDGRTVEIPRERIYEVRLDFAAQGLPRGGMGFEVFDDAKLGMTEFVQNINYQRALQGELSRTVNGLSEVESSRVHIVISKPSLFIEDEEPASASIILKLRHGKYLSSSQVQGIVHLVSSSVPRLRPEHVTVVDQEGKMLAGFDQDPSITRLSADHLDFQHKKEKLLEQRVLTMLEKVLGHDKAIVRVACDLDFVQQEQTEEKYLPENQVVRSEQQLSETSSQNDTGAIGVPGLDSDITQPRPIRTNKTSKAKEFQKRDKTRNYEIGKTTSHRIMPVGKLQRLSVAVVVDGTYKKVMVGKGNEKHEETEYAPRSPEEIKVLENIVKSAVNFSDARGDRVEVANIAFNTDPLIVGIDEQGGQWLEPLKPYASILKYSAVALFVLFTFMFVIRPLINWLTDTAWEDVDLIEQLPRTLSEIEREYAAGEASDTYLNEAAQLIEANKEDSSRLMQQWLKET